MNINKISSSSKGNAVLISDGKSKILLDAGLPYKKLSESVKISDLEAVLITHEHMDHCKGVYDLSLRGVEIYMSHGTYNQLSKKSSLISNHLYHLHQVNLKNWIVLPFDVKHDAVEPMGFLFQSKNTKEKGVYIVDSAYVSYDFKGVTHYLIEANHSVELLEKSNYNDFLKQRVKKNHFSFENLKKFLSNTDLSKTKEIHLLHLSESNSDEKKYVTEIEKLTGVPVYV